MVPFASLLIFQFRLGTAGEKLGTLSKLLALSAVPIALLVLGVYLVRRMFLQIREESDISKVPRPRGVPEQTAFAVSAFQGVIEKMREQEKELDRLHRSERLRSHESEQLSATIMSNMATGLVILNKQGVITESNPAAKAVLGHDLLVGRSFREVFWADRLSGAPEPEIVQNMDLCLATGQTFRRNTFTYHAPRGESKVLGVGLSPILAEGVVTGVICLLSDLTEITALQQQVRLKENLAALGEMSAGIAHEFKNSLATISGYAQLIAGEEELDGARQHASRIVTETRFLTQIVTDFLHFSRPLSLVACDVSIRSLLEEVFLEVTSRNDFPGVRLELAGEFPNVTADQTLLRQCFSNLIRNSCEAIAETESEGLIQVEGQLETSDAGAMVRLTFHDNGPGIAADNLDKVFIPFFTTKKAGTGLGLALVHKIVVNHNGKIQVSSEPGEGTSFIVTLPIGASMAASADV